MNTANSQATMYVTENGIDRMFSDLEHYIYPLFAKFQPLMYVLAKIAFLIIPLVAIGIILYLHFYKKHRFGNKLYKKNNYIFWGASLVVYIVLSFISIDIYDGFSINTNAFVLPVIAKFFGPYVAGLFAIVQYTLMAIIKEGNFNFLLMLVAAIGGLIYGLFFYKKRTRYSRCLGGKLVVNIVCNILLTVFVIHPYSTYDIAYLMTFSAIEALLISPIQALVIFITFRLIRIIENQIKNRVKNKVK